MFHRIGHMLVKEFLQMLRDPRMRGVVLVMPVVQLTIMAFALTTDVKDIRMAVVDPDNTPESRRLVSGFTAGGYFRVTEHLTSYDNVDRLLDQGDVLAVLRFPQDFASDIRAGRGTRVQFLADGVQANDTSITMDYASRVAARYNREVMADRSAAAGVSPASVDLRTRGWFNPNLESKFFFVPGLIAVMLLLIGLVLTSMAIVREKEIGTIEQVMVTPIRRTEFILGKTLPFLITGYITMTIMFVIARLLFGIVIEGSVALLYLLAGVFMLGNLGLAMLVSVTAKTQQQALLTTFFIIMPCILLSGFIFPIRNMPEPVQVATLANPMRWFLVIVRAIVVKGVGLHAIAQAASAQAILAATFLTLAVVKFRKTME